MGRPLVPSSSSSSVRAPISTARTTEGWGPASSRNSRIAAVAQPSRGSLPRGRAIANVAPSSTVRWKPEAARAWDRPEARKLSFRLAGSGTTALPITNAASRPPRSAPAWAMKRWAMARRRSATGVAGRCHTSKSLTRTWLHTPWRTSRSAGPASSGWGAGRGRRSWPHTRTRQPCCSRPQRSSCSSVLPPSVCSSSRQGWLGATPRGRGSSSS